MLPQQLPIDLDRWTPAVHDRLIADTQSNIGYIVHEDGNFTMFRIGSGKQRVVNYLGRTYNASTPSGSWKVLSTKVFANDHITFGKTGLFLRLSQENDETSYGIHATANIDTLLTWSDRYKSYGCILVNNDVLDILKKTYELSGNELDVATVYGIESIGLIAINP